MSARVTVSVSAVATPQPAAATPTGRLFVIGRAAEGTYAVTKVTGMAQFRETWGDRVTNNQDLFDTCRLAFSEGCAEVYVLRAFGPSKTTEELDDWANADYADLLDLFGADLGTGVVAVAGKRYSDVGEDLAAHAIATNRLAIVSLAEADDDADAISAAGTIDGYTGADHVIIGWPWVTMPTSNGSVTAEPTGYLAGCRARAHAGVGAWQSPILARYGTAQYVSGPTIDTGDVAWEALNDAGVSVVRRVGGVTRLYGWKTAASVTGDTDGILQGAQYRDLTNLIAADLNKIAESFVGVIVDGKGLRLAEFGGAITGRLGSLADAGALFARVNDDGDLMDPGYVVDAGPSVNSPISLATGLLKAEVGVRLSPTAEMVSITVTAGDAAAGL